jgi:hypothetical protein
MDEIAYELISICDTKNRIVTITDIDTSLKGKQLAFIRIFDNKEKSHPYGRLLVYPIIRK